LTPLFFFETRVIAFMSDNVGRRSKGANVGYSDLSGNCGTFVKNMQLGRAAFSVAGVEGEKAEIQSSTNEETAGSND
jgi:hypothetical protein